MNQRGVSPVVGMALLLGLTAIVSVGLLVVGMSAVGSTTDAAKEKQTTASMAEFATTTEQLTEGESETGSFHIDGHQGGTASVNESEGRITVELVNGSTTDQIVDSDLGVFRYESDTGNEFAYQGGGVWRVDGDTSTMVRAPTFEYNARPVPTLTFPHVVVRGDATNSGSFSGSLSVDQKEELYPANSSFSNPVTGDGVVVTIQSDYARGWQNHITDRTNVRVEESYDQGTQDRVVVNFSVPDYEDVYNTTTTEGEDGEDGEDPEDGDDPDEHDPEDFDPVDVDAAVEGQGLLMRSSAAVVQGDVAVNDLRKSPQAVVTGNRTSYNESMPDVDHVHEYTSDDSLDWQNPIDDTSDPNRLTIEGGGLHAIRAPSGGDGIDMQQNTLEIDASNETTILVDGDVEVGGLGNIEIEGDELVNFMVDGSVTLDSSSTFFGNAANPEQVMVQATGDLHISGQTDYYAVMHAPEGRIVANGQSHIEGAVLSNQTEIHASTLDFREVDFRDYSGGGNEGNNGTGDPDSGSDGTDGTNGTSDTDVELDDEEDVYYLHLSKTVVEVED